jgi:hypothetical protein
MRRAIVVLLLSFLPLVCAAAPTLEGRWQGTVRIPGRETQAVVDLARDATGAWAGSITLPGLGVKGAPLSNIVATGNGVRFDLGNLLSTPEDGPARFQAHLSARDRVAGEMRQGGNVARFSLEKTGSAQVEPARRSTAVGRALEDQWLGEFELGGYPRRVTLTLVNHANAAATATFVVAGKQINNLPVELVVEEGRFLRIESPSARVSFEGRLFEDSDELKGTIEVGPFELPLALHRASRRAS